jgi:hypothetical protein
MNSFMKIAAMVVASAPLALIGCMGEPIDDEMDQSVAQAEQSGDASKGGIKVTDVEAGGGCAAPCEAPAYTAPTTQAPSYPAPSYGAPRHAAPVYKAPAYQSPTYQSPSVVPGFGAPSYTAPSYPGPTYNAPVYESPSYGAPTFLAPIFEAPTFLAPNPMLAPNPAARCLIQSQGQSAQNP